MRMNIFFDVDFTLITWDYRLRPHVREVFQRLKDDGHAVYLWSGVGRRWEIVEQFGLHEYIADCFEKPLFRHVDRLTELGVTVRPDFVIDDHAEPVDAFGGVHIRPPHTPLDADTEMLRVYEEVRRFAASAPDRHAEEAAG